jgi:hypothetical protein
VGPRKGGKIAIDVFRLYISLLACALIKRMEESSSSGEKEMTGEMNAPEDKRGSLKHSLQRGVESTTPLRQDPTRLIVAS